MRTVLSKATTMVLAVASSVNASQSVTLLAGAGMLLTQSAGGHSVWCRKRMDAVRVARTAERRQPPPGFATVRSIPSAPGWSSTLPGSSS